MDWAIGIPILLLLLVCPLIMLGMVAFGWLFGRRFMGSHGSGNGHGGHGMMMCMGHGESGHETGDPSTGSGQAMKHGSASPDLVEELRAERERLDALIARAEGDR